MLLASDNNFTCFDKHVLPAMYTNRIEAFLENVNLTYNQVGNLQGHRPKLV